MAEVAEETLYEIDYYAWTQEQAALLRDMAARRVNTPLDLGNLAEEVEDLGKSERDTVRSEVQRILEHLLKLEYSPAKERFPGPPIRATTGRARSLMPATRSPTA